MGVKVLLAGCIFFPTVNQIVKQILKTFTGLNTTDQYFITEKCVNIVQAVMSTAVGAWIAYTCQQDIMNDTCWLTNAYTWFGLPYFLYDIWAMYGTHLYLNVKTLEDTTLLSRLIHFLRNNIAMVIHHIMLPMIYFPVILYIRNNRGDYFVGVFFMCEAAIPFIGLRFILAQLQLKHTAWYIGSGLLMIAVFFVTRICLFPFLYWKYSIYAEIPFMDSPFHIPIKCNIGCLIILMLQVYFLALMVRGAVRVFYKMYKSKKSK